MTQDKHYAGPIGNLTDEKLTQLGRELFDKINQDVAMHREGAKNSGDDHDGPQHQP